MPKRISEGFKIRRHIFFKTGAFDSWLDQDSPLFIDPLLLNGCSAPEFNGSRDDILAYYGIVIRILLNSTPNDRGWRAAKERLAFKEMPGLSLGYSKGSTRGSGIGKDFAGTILKTAYEILQIGINDPALFEVIGLFEDGIGADRISDMTANIVNQRIYAYSQRIFSGFPSVHLNKFNIGGDQYLLPRNPFNNNPVIVVPRDLLDELPIAVDHDDIGRVCSFNEDLREKFNSFLGENWMKQVKKYSKRQLKEFVFERPEILSGLIETYSKVKPKKYDFEADPKGELIIDFVRDFFETEFESLKKWILRIPNNASDIVSSVREICESVKRMIEEKQMWKLLYRDDAYTTPKYEGAVQVLFDGLCEQVCDKYDLDITREPETGRGPVDFKFSRGSKSKVIVEIKLSSHGRLIHAFDSQVQIYQKAVDAVHAILLVVVVDEKPLVISRLFDHANSSGLSPEKRPEIILIDATPKISGSKA